MFPTPFVCCVNRLRPFSTHCTIYAPPQKKSRISSLYKAHQYNARTMCDYTAARQITMCNQRNYTDRLVRPHQ